MLKVTSKVLYGIISFYLFLYPMYVYTQCTNRSIALEIDVDIDSNTRIYKVPEGFFLLTENTVIKINDSGKQEAEYTNNLYSDITYIDLKNPLMLMLFYQDIGEIAILDRQLSEKNIDVSFEEYVVANQYLVAIANSSEYWLYDPTLSILHRIRDNGSRVLHVENLRFYLKNTQHPKIMRDMHNMLYLFFKNEGFYIFDRQGNYVRNITVERDILDFFVLSSGDIIYYDTEAIYRYQSIIHKEVVVSHIDVKNYSVFVDRNMCVYILCEDRIEIHNDRSRK